MNEDGHEVLGNLPKRRPSIQSPRRAQARATSAEAPADAPSDSAAETGRSDIAEIERLAVGGVRLAAGAAATGLKLAGRTVGGLGRVMGRR
jgi:hypothetical protein